MHLGRDGGTQDLCINLGGFDIDVAQHPTHSLDRHPIGQSDGRGKCVTGRVKCYALVDPYLIRYVAEDIVAMPIRWQ